MLATKHTGNAFKSLQIFGSSFDTAPSMLKWFRCHFEINTSFDPHSLTDRTDIHLGDHGAALVCFHLKF